MLYTVNCWWAYLILYCLENSKLQCCKYCACLLVMPEILGNEERKTSCLDKRKKREQYAYLRER